MCFHLYIRYGFGVASSRNQPELAETKKNFTNKGQSTSGPIEALKDPLSISFCCLSLFICFTPHFSAASSRNRLWHPHSSHASSLQLWPPTQTGGCLSSGFAFFRDENVIGQLGPDVCLQLFSSRVVERMLAWPFHSDMMPGLPLGSSGLDSWEGMSWWADLFKSTCRALTRFAVLDQQYIVERKMQRRAGQVWGSQGTLPDLVPIASRPQWWKCPLIVYSPACDWFTYVSLNTGCSSWFKWHGNILGQSEFIIVVYSWICSL